MCEETHTSHAAECLLLARRVRWRRRSNSVAFGAKRTFVEPRSRTGFMSTRPNSTTAGAIPSRSCPALRRLGKMWTAPLSAPDGSPESILWTGYANAPGWSGRRRAARDAVRRFCLRCRHAPLAEFDLPAHTADSPAYFPNRFALGHCVLGFNSSGEGLKWILTFWSSGLARPG